MGKNQLQEGKSAQHPSEADCVGTEESTKDESGRETAANGGNRRKESEQRLPQVRRKRRTADLPLLGQAEQNNDEVHAGSKRATEDEGA
jgi:hypothetical protein